MCPFCTLIKDELCPYTDKGQLFRNRQGYCPMVNEGPNKPKPKDAKVVRMGQQKQSKAK